MEARKESSAQGKDFEELALLSGCDKCFPWVLALSSVKWARVYMSGQTGLKARLPSRETLSPDFLFFHPPLPPVPRIEPWQRIEPGVLGMLHEYFTHSAKFPALWFLSPPSFFFHRICTPPSPPLFIEDETQSLVCGSKSNTSPATELHLSPFLCFIHFMLHMWRSEVTCGVSPLLPLCGGLRGQTWVFGLAT